MRERLSRIVRNQQIRVWIQYKIKFTGFRLLFSVSDIWFYKRAWYILQNTFIFEGCQQLSCGDTCQMRKWHSKGDKCLDYYDVIKWKHFPCYWPFVRGIHRSPVNSSHKGQWRGALVFSLICAWINGYVNTREAGDLRRLRTHYDVTVMTNQESSANNLVISSLLHWFDCELIPSNEDTLTVEMIDGYSYIYNLHLHDNTKNNMGGISICSYIELPPTDGI